MVILMDASVIVEEYTTYWVGGFWFGEVARHTPAMTGMPISLSASCT